MKRVGNNWELCSDWEASWEFCSAIGLEDELHFEIGLLLHHSLVKMDWRRSLVSLLFTIKRFAITRSRWIVIK